MIPFVEDLNMFTVTDMPDMFSTCQEFLDLGGGDYEEHAILLCNYFKHIDNLQNPGVYESYVVFGEAMPMGDTVYVMRKNLKPIQVPGQ
jgi:coiled-coil and C2 domain-containing protein 2A